MSVDFDKLNRAPRILIEADLKPVAGTPYSSRRRFPDLGAAVYDAPDGTPMLLVESAQSMANRLETVCWDGAGNDLVADLTGLPYVTVALAGLGDGSDKTSSFLEFHRLNSPYIMSGVTTDSKPFADVLKPELGMVAVPSGNPKTGPEKKDDRRTLVA